MYIIKYMMSIYIYVSSEYGYDQKSTTAEKRSMQQQTYQPLQTIGQWLPNSYMWKLKSAQNTLQSCRPSYINMVASCNFPSSVVT